MDVIKLVKGARELLLRRAAESAHVVQETWALGSRFPGDPSFHDKMDKLVRVLEDRSVRAEDDSQGDPRRSDFGQTG
ncbi:hypothetical protein [Modestobacter marinus]|uniref:hypothetical protein n=1 Tax=Modestobacter marinus TaxID=477641 RepID=UPI001C93D816|nr:hypothetical protein [Modestobacter marinus]